MTLLLTVFAVGVVLELTIGASMLGWRARKVLTALALLAATFAATGLLLLGPTLWTAGLVLVTLYRGFGLLRIVQGRMHEGYLRRSSRRTSMILITLQVLLLGAGWLWQRYAADIGQVAWVALASLQLAGAGVLLASTWRRLARTAWPQHTPTLSDTQLPTLTVAIPARNETDELQACLDSLLASDYPKLEIIVLDDCSQTKRTPEIIRQYAHDGVRFIAGSEPPATWLPRNWAYEQLVQQASGDYLLFCCVDVRFSPTALRQTVSLMQTKHKQMLCVLPWRAADVTRNVVIQAMRYAWELVPPRRWLRRPPVLSTCWLITREALARAGGFAAATRSIVPEAHLARQLIASDAYSFVRASDSAGIESYKGYTEQYQTAIRMRYPQLHRRPENVLLASASMLALLVLPFAVAVAGFALGVGVIAQVLALAASVLLASLYLRLVWATRTGNWLLGALGLPYSVLADLALLHKSMWQYEFSQVDWKGRNICIPAMHVIPHLPKLQD